MRLPRIHWPSRRHLRLDQGIKTAILEQIQQPTTVVALLNAAALLTSWKVDPDKVAAVGTLLSAVDAVLLAVVQEGPAPTQPPQATTPGAPQ